MPPLAAEIEIKASLHQKCRTFLKLSHQECLISCRGSVWSQRRTNASLKGVCPAILCWNTITAVINVLQSRKKLSCGASVNISNSQKQQIGVLKSNYTSKQENSVLLALLDMYNNINSLRNHSSDFRRKCGSTSAALNVGAINMATPKMPSRRSERNYYLPGRWFKETKCLLVLADRKEAVWRNHFNKKLT